MRQCWLRYVKSVEQVTSAYLFLLSNEHNDAQSIFISKNLEYLCGIL